MVNEPPACILELGQWMAETDKEFRISLTGLTGRPRYAGMILATSGKGSYLSHGTSTKIFKRIDSRSGTLMVGFSWGLRS